MAASDEAKASPAGGRTEGASPWGSGINPGPQVGEDDNEDEACAQQLRRPANGLPVWNMAERGIGRRERLTDS